jgi:hypothetical protein
MTLIEFTSGTKAKASEVNANFQELEDSLLDTQASLLATQTKFNNLKIYNVIDYGAEGDGETDDTSAIQDAITAAETALATVYFPSGTYKITSGIAFDASKTNLYGEGAIVDASSVVGVACTIDSTSIYTTLYNNFNKTAIYGIGFISDVGTSHTGTDNNCIELDISSSAGGADILFDRVYIYGFDKQIVFSGNCWRTKFQNCGFYKGNYPYYFNSPTNSGEVMTFEHCNIVDWYEGIYQKNGDFYFNTCSFFGGAIGPIVLEINAHMVISNSNIEVQGTSLNEDYMFDVSGSSVLNINGSTMLINTGKTLTYPIIKLDSSGGAKVNLTNNRLPFYGTNLSMYTNAISGKQINAIVEASGTYGAYVSATGNSTLVGDRGAMHAIVGGHNSLSNGGAELGNTNNWTIVPYGSGGSLTASNASGHFKNGSYGFLFTGISGGGLNASQSINVSGQAGRLFTFALWCKALSGSSDGYLQCKFYDANGTDISYIENTIVLLHTYSDWTWNVRSGIVPIGAVTAKVNLSLSGLNSQVIDDIYLELN